MSHRTAFVVGFAFLSFVVAGIAQEKPAAPREKPKGSIDVTAWANAPDDVECGLVVAIVYPEGESEAGRARCTFFHEGVVRIEAPIAASKPKGPGDAKTAAAQESVEIYRSVDRLVVNHVDGHWSALGIGDLGPEEVTEGNTSFASSFSRKLIAAVGGPALPNLRAGRVQEFALVKDPRELVRASLKSDHSSIGSLVVSAPPSSSPVGVDLRDEVVKHLLGPNVECSKGRVLLTANADGAVTEIELQLRQSDNYCTKPEDPKFWNARLTFKEIRHVAESKVPDDVKKLLQDPSVKPGK
jgi:hypothetical protein